MSPTAHIEAILFVASKPMTYTALAKATGLTMEEVTTAIHTLQSQYTDRAAGIQVVVSGAMVQLATAPACADAVAAFHTKELTGELTKPQLESLTVVAYQGPITRPELEEIRGVNSAVILRTLLLRGLIVESQSPDALLPVYTMSIDALRMLGVSSVEELPEYESLHAHPHITASDVDSDESTVHYS